MKTLAIICVLAFVYVYSEACSCVFQHPQVHFCNADFVVSARIWRRVETGTSPFDDVYYAVTINRHYKGGTRIGGISQRIYTARHGASCGVSFQIGRQYIIAGDIRNNRWRANLCSWNPQISSLTQVQRNALRYGYYRDNCYCNVRDCTIINHPQCSVSRRNECLITTNSDCFRRHNFCSFNGRSCSWRYPYCSHISRFGSRSATSSLK